MIRKGIKRVEEQPEQSPATPSGGTFEAGEGAEPADKKVSLEQRVAAVMLMAALFGAIGFAVFLFVVDIFYDAEKHLGDEKLEEIIALEELSRAIQEFDFDQSGNIQLQNVETQLSADQAGRLLQIDLNQDYMLSREDAVPVLESLLMRKEMKPIGMEVRDPRQNSVPLKEWERFGGDTELFRFLDADGDRSLTLEDLGVQ